jgi:hypothetical protein
MSFHFWYLSYLLVAPIGYSLAFIFDVVDEIRTDKGEELFAAFVVTLFWPLVAVVLLCVGYLKLLKFSRVKFRKHKEAFKIKMAAKAIRNQQFRGTKTKLPYWF